MPYGSVFRALEIFFRNRALRALLLPVNTHDPPTTAVMEQLNAVDPAHEWFGIVSFVARFVRAPDMRDAIELFGATRNFLLEESVFLDMIADAGDKAVDVQQLRRDLAIDVYLSGILGGRNQTRARNKQ